ncbi:MAG: PAS domain S-box protein [Chloroflexota bacterium]
MTTRVFWRLAQWVTLPVLYGFAALFSEWLTISDGAVASLWIPPGLALAALLLGGRQVCPGILLGMIAFYTLRGLSLPTAVLSIAAEVMEIFLAAALIQRWPGSKLCLKHPHNTLKFVAVVALSCLAGTAFLALGALSGASAAFGWSAHANGMILATPLLLAMRPLSGKLRLEAVLLVACAAAATGVIFCGCLPGGLAASLPYLLVLFLLWPALRLDQATTHLTALAILVIALAATRLGHGPLAALGVAERLTAVQLFGSVMALCALLLGSLVSKPADSLTAARQTPDDAVASTHHLLDQLNASEARWRAILENAPMTITMTDLDGRILALSRSFSAHKPVDALIGEDFYAYLPPENQARVRNVTATVVQSGQPAYFDMAFVRPDGSRSWFANHIVPVAQDGGLSALIYLATDITERKIAEQASRTNEERLRAIIDAAPFGAHSYELFADGQLIFSGYNLAAEQILGITHASVVGKTIEEAFPGLVGTPLPAVYRRVAAHGERYHNEQIVYHESQVEGVFEVHAFQTSPHHMTVFFRDVTERKKADEQIRQMTEELELRVRQRTSELEATNHKLETINLELESLSYTVSHDLRSPLRAIDGYSHIVMDEYGAELPADALRRMKAIRSNAQQMGQLIDDLLTFVHLGRQTLALRQVHMQALVEQALIALEDELVTRQIEVAIGELPACTGDPSLLRQVWLNLISNAVKFTRHRQLARIEIASEQCNGETIYLVRDNGTGFDMQYADKLFGMFQRLHVQEQYEGTGVGLAIVERIIRKHGGRIWTRAQPDEGATFYFVVS